MSGIICSALEYIMVLFIIMDCNSVISIVGINGIIIKALSVVMLLLYLIHNTVLKRNKYKRKIIYFTFLYVIYESAILCFNNPNSYAHYIFNQILIFVILILCFSIKGFKHLFFYRYTNMMYLLCTISLIFYVFGTLLNIVQPSSYVDANWGPMDSYKTYYHLYNEAQGTWFFGNPIIRNISIFAEAPMFAYCVCFALWYQLFFCKKNILKLSVFIISIMTAFSVTGYIFTLIMAVLKYIQVKTEKKSKFTFKELIILVLFIISIIFGIYLFVDKLDSVSGISRLNQYVNALRIINDNPLFGCGYKMNDEGGFSSGLLLVLVECGIAGSVQYFLPAFIMTVYGIARSRYEYIALALGFLAIIALTVAPYKVLTLCILAFMCIELIDSFVISKK